MRFLAYFFCYLAQWCMAIHAAWKFRKTVTSYHKSDGSVEYKRAGFWWYLSRYAKNITWTKHYGM